MRPRRRRLATSEPSVGPSEGPRERPFGALCTAEAHRLQRTSHGPTGSSPSRIRLPLFPFPPLPPSHVLLASSSSSSSSSSSCPPLTFLSVLLQPVSRRSLDSSNRLLRATRSTTIPRFRLRTRVESSVPREEIRRMLRNFSVTLAKMRSAVANAREMFGSDVNREIRDACESGQKI